jgi:hypothetical protein
VDGATAWHGTWSIDGSVVAVRLTHELSFPQRPPDLQDTPELQKVVEIDLVRAQDALVVIRETMPWWPVGPGTRMVRMDLADAAGSADRLGVVERDRIQTVWEHEFTTELSPFRSGPPTLRAGLPSLEELEGIIAMGKTRYAQAQADRTQAVIDEVASLRPVGRRLIDEQIAHATRKWEVHSRYHDRVLAVAVASRSEAELESRYLAALYRYAVEIRRLRRAFSKVLYEASAETDADGLIALGVLSHHDE